ncbi:hypothetical protein Bbelb_303940 [Branchiostoma belcheri]|nr:hypothetical protein Bbelb_303940 [Branchiostoma belcheri]
MAAADTPTSLEHAYKKEKGIDAERDSKQDVDVPNMNPGRQSPVPNQNTLKHKQPQEKISSIPEKGKGGDSKIQSMAAPGIYTNPEHGGQPSDPNIYTPVTARGKNTKQVKEEVPSISEKNIREDNKNQSKVVNRGKHAYEETVIGKETTAGFYGTGASIYTDLQPVTAEPRYLHVGDHVVVYSGQELEDTYGYREAEEVNKGFEGDHYYRDYEKPEDVSVGFEEPDDVHTYKGLEENHYSHDYDKPEDVHAYKDPVKESFAFKAKASAVISVILATHITHGGRVSLQQNGTMVLGPIQVSIRTSWQPEFYGENNSAFNMVNLTLTYLPFINSNSTVQVLLTTVTYTSTTDLNECAKTPCRHGRCVNQDGGYKCICSVGWTGQNCQQDMDECNKKPCQHGRCVNKDGGYKCTCSPGRTGQNCQQDIDECKENPCHHGRCVNREDGYKCTCSLGWTGQNCDQDIDECNKNPANMDAV